MAWEKRLPGIRQEVLMRTMKYFALLALLMVPLAYSQAQVSVGVGIGVGPGFYGPRYLAGPPVCAYGYYDYAPYPCAPYGFYGPDFFVDGVFIGAGPWYHWGHPVGFWNRGYYGRPAWGRGYYGRPGFEGRDYDRGYNRGFERREFERGFQRGEGREHEFRGGDRGGFHGGGSFHGDRR